MPICLNLLLPFIQRCARHGYRASSWSKGPDGISGFSSAAPRIRDGEFLNLSLFRLIERLLSSSLRNWVNVHQTVSRFSSRSRGFPRNSQTYPKSSSRGRSEIEPFSPELKRTDARHDGAGTSRHSFPSLFRTWAGNSRFLCCERSATRMFSPFSLKK